MEFSREAFDPHFHAARIAAMTYLSTEVSRWGLLRRILPRPYNKQFKEFNKWYRKVEKLINSLEHEIKEVVRNDTYLLHY